MQTFDSHRGIVRRGVWLWVSLLILLWVLAACAGVPTPTVPADMPTTTPRVTPAPLPAAAQKTEFPPIAVPPDNLTTPARSELGRQLFYDPVLSASKTMSCATCHHPDQGLANGQATSTPRPGAPARNVPTLWNVGYNRHLLWDGRETSLESQARQPLTLPNEMAADPDQLVANLRAIPAYVALFDAAYGGGAESITFDNVTRALAAYQRTLISQDSPFDRYVSGDGRALTAAQQRGLDIFFSERTHCAECHQAPTFASETFRVVGVASDDPGRAGVSDKGLRGAFKIPTLRNIALTAPYMHNGSIDSLDEVVQFYADGAGRPRGVAGVDPLLKGFELSAAEKADLVAFLQALTDESALPDVPERALSGLPVAAQLR